MNPSTGLVSVAMLVGGARPARAGGCNKSVYLSSPVCKQELVYNFASRAAQPNILTPARAEVRASSMTLLHPMARKGGGGSVAERIGLRGGSR